MEGTFHRRKLGGSSISFSSPEGKDIFKQALAEGNMEGYFLLAEHFVTQGHPAFCGIGSLTMALNSLLVDPKRIWQGVWRWFDESMLDCCEELDVVRLKGIILPKLACLARCNGARVTMKYGTEVTVEQFREHIMLVTALPNNSACPLGDGNSTCALKENSASKEPVKSSVPMDFPDSSSLPPAHCCDTSNPNMGSDVDQSVRNVMIVSYCRSTLRQTGSGHFSPIGGYCGGRDMVLILDVARFKYPPHWVPLSELYNAMLEVDPESGKCRGYLLLSASAAMVHKCECSPPAAGPSSSSSSSISPVSVPVIESASTGGTTTGSFTEPTDTAAVVVPEAEKQCSRVNGGVVTTSLSEQEPVSLTSITAGTSTAGCVHASNTTCGPTPAERLTTLIQHSCPFCT
jgi:glutathione gamma-glutamylcysteinyltransferase